MNGLFKNITYSGLSSVSDHQDKRGVLLSNYVAIILSLLITFLFLMRHYVYGEVAHKLSAGYYLLGFVLFLMPIVLNRLSHTILSRLWLSHIPIFLIWFIYINKMSGIEVVETTVYDSFRIFLLVLSFIPYLVFTKSKPLTLLLGILPALVSFLFFEHLLGFVGLSHSIKGIPGEDYQIMQMRTLIAYIVLSSGCYTFQSIIGKNDEYNERIKDLLKKQSYEIVVQNRELINSEKELKFLNRRLEELNQKKAENIKQQNEIIVKYAYSNGHQLRAPVARLLGLVSLSKMETDLNYRLFFNMIEQETIEIDHVVKQISKELNKLEIDIANELH